MPSSTSPTGSGAPAPTATPPGARIERPTPASTNPTGSRAPAPTAAPPGNRPMRPHPPSWHPTGSQCCATTLAPPGSPPQRRTNRRPSSTAVGGCSTRGAQGVLCSSRVWPTALARSPPPPPRTRATPARRRREPWGPAAAAPPAERGRRAGSRARGRAGAAPGGRLAPRSSSDPVGERSNRIWQRRVRWRWRRRRQSRGARILVPARCPLAAFRWATLFFLLTVSLRIRLRSCRYNLPRSTPSSSGMGPQRGWCELAAARALALPALPAAVVRRAETCVGALSPRGFLLGTLSPGAGRLVSKSFITHCKV